MTTNNNTANDAIFDNDSDVTDVDTGAVGVAAGRTPSGPVRDRACCPQTGDATGRQVAQHAVVGLARHFHVERLGRGQASAVERQFSVIWVSN